MAKSKAKSTREEKVRVGSHTRRGSRVNPFSRTQKVSNKKEGSKRNIGVKLAAIGVGGVGIVAAARYGVPKLGLGKKLNTFVETQTHNLSRSASRGVTSGAVRGGLNGIPRGASQVVGDVAQSAKKQAAAVQQTPQNTARAFQEGLQTSTAKDSGLNRIARGLGRTRARAEARAREDIKKARSFLQLSRIDEESHPRLWEFSRRRRGHSEKTKRKISISLSQNSNQTAKPSKAVTAVNLGINAAIGYTVLRKLGATKGFDKALVSGIRQGRVGVKKGLYNTKAGISNLKSNLRNRKKIKDLNKTFRTDFPNAKDKFSMDCKKLIEFSQPNRKASRRRSKPMSAAHKKAISRGLQDYYSTVPGAPDEARNQPKIDRVEQGTKAIQRLARSGKTIAETANLASSIYDRYKKPQYNLRSDLSLGAGLLNSVSGSARNLTGSARTVVDTADRFNDLKRGSKSIKEGLASRGLGIKEQGLVRDLANSAFRQTESTRRDSRERESNNLKRDLANLRSGMSSAQRSLREKELAQKRAYDDRNFGLKEIGLKQSGSKAESYGLLTRTVAATKPLATISAAQRAATGAKKESIEPGSSHWFMDGKALNQKPSDSNKSSSPPPAKRNKIRRRTSSSSKRKSRAQLRE